MFRKHRLAHFAHLLEEDALASANGRYYRIALSKNQSRAAVEFLATRPELIEWNVFSMNPSATPELMRLAPNKDHGGIDWHALSRNPAMIPFLKDNFGMAQWYQLSSNSGAIEMLLENVDKIDWGELGRNSSVMDFLKDRYCKEALLYGPSLSDQDRKNAAIKLGDSDSIRFDMFHRGLHKNMYGGHSDFFANLSLNEHAVPFLQNNIWCVCWKNIQRNTAAVPILTEFSGMIHMRDFCYNTSPETMALVLERMALDRKVRRVRIYPGIEVLLWTIRRAGDLLEVCLIPLYIPAIVLFVGYIRLLCMFFEPMVWSMCLGCCIFFGNWFYASFFFIGVTSVLKRRSDHLYRIVLNQVTSWGNIPVVYNDEISTTDCLLKSKHDANWIMLSLFSRWLRLPVIVELTKYVGPGHYYYSIEAIWRNPGAWDILMKYPDLWGNGNNRDTYAYTHHWKNIILHGTRYGIPPIFIHPQCYEFWISPITIPWIETEAYPPDRIWWEAVSVNPGAMAILEKNRHTAGVQQHVLENPSVFEECYDYAAIKLRMDGLREDLMKVVFHPRRLAKWLRDAENDPEEWL